MLICRTERLLLRRLSTDDAGFILELLNDPSFRTNITSEDLLNLWQGKPTPDGITTLLMNQTTLEAYRVLETPALVVISREAATLT